MRIAIIIAIYLCFPIIIAIGFQKWDIVRKIGTVISAYAVGIVMSLTGLVSFETGSADAELLQSVQKWIMNITVPLAIPLMLLSSDFKLWSKTLSKTVYALIGGLLSVLVAVVVAFFVFKNAGIDNFPDILAMMVGIYTGGTMNFAALGTALHINSTIMTCLMTIEMLITFPYLLFVIGGGFKLFRRILPFHETDENYEHMLDRRIAPFTAIAIGISLIFLAIGAGISLALTGTLQEMIVILTVTTLAIIASFFRKIRRLPKTFEMGMILILMFSVDVASQLDFSILASCKGLYIDIIFDGDKKLTIKNAASFLTDPALLLFIFVCLLCLLFFEVSSAITSIVCFAVPVILIIRMLLLERRLREGIEKYRIPIVTVLRDGNEMIISARALIEGDLILLKKGDIVPADCKLVSTERLKVVTMCKEADGAVHFQYVSKNANEALSLRKKTLFLNWSRFYFAALKLSREKHGRS